MPGNPLQARAKALGITLVERDWIPSSRRAHECTEFARARGTLDAFHAGVLKAYWTDGRDIHAWDVLEELAGAAGLDAAAMRASVERGEWSGAVDERVNAAHDLAGPLRPGPLPPAPPVETGALSTLLVQVRSSSSRAAWSGRWPSASASRA